MQYLTISNNDTLQSLSKIVGRQNVELVLAENSLERVPKVGRQYKENYDAFVSEYHDDVTPSRKAALLNTLTDNEEVFEKACLMDDTEWKFFSEYQSFQDAIKVPVSVNLPYSTRVIGSNIGNGVVQVGSNVGLSTTSGVDAEVYSSVMKSLRDNDTIDPSIFNRVNSQPPASLTGGRGTLRQQARVPQYAYNLPWGKVIIYSSVLDQSIDIPAYPEEMETERSANYTAMPDIIYQYEPWIVYQSSGPRTQTIDFHLHRDLWSGDHRDGRANALIRFCEANTFPKYSGSNVVSSIVKIFIAGKLFISGVLTRTRVSWSGPLGLDNWYLEFKLSLTIQEVSEFALNINSVSQLGLIG